MSKEKYGRRDILASGVSWLVTGLISALVPRSVRAAYSGPHQHQALREAMSVAYLAQESVRFVGRRYLASHPWEQDIDKLAADLFGGQSEPVSPKNVRKILDQHRADDFAADRCVSVDGWLLARSEARAAALIALL